MTLVAGSNENSTSCKFNNALVAVLDLDQEEGEEDEEVEAILQVLSSVNKRQTVLSSVPLSGTAWIVNFYFSALELHPRASLHRTLKTLLLCSSRVEHVFWKRTTVDSARLVGFALNQGWR